MRFQKFFGVLLTVLLLLGLSPSVGAETPGVSAQAAVLMDADSGRVLFAKEEHKRLSMASTTKIMTALITVEQGNLDREITVTDEMVRVEGSAMGLRAGDKVTMEGLVYGMLLPSGNDAANAAALSIAGSADAFAELMNQEAQELGAKDTHFVTPSGLDAEEHYSTAYDMALIGSAAMKNEKFSSISATKSTTVTFGNPPREVWLSNHNRLLKEYDGTIGVKTGFTKKSGRCLVSCAERDGVRLVVVTLNAPDDWNDHKRLFDYGFDQLTDTELPAPLPIQLPVTGGMESSVEIWCSERVHTALLAGEESLLTTRMEVKPFLYAPVREGDEVGELVYLIGDREVARVPLAATRTVEARPERSVWEKIADFFGGLFGWATGDNQEKSAS
ncbi:MAG: D-alanyl-D-alanine carboxypeptidase [Clostridiales bacterium]|nr:D-alanyl-D-alanine carboxypeptidase [Clostridiales bacterium]